MFDTQQARIILGHPEDVPNQSEVSAIRKTLHDAIHHIEDIVACHSLSTLLGALNDATTRKQAVTLIIPPDVARFVLEALTRKR